MIKGQGSRRVRRNPYVRAAMVGVAVVWLTVVYFQASHLEANIQTQRQALAQACRQADSRRETADQLATLEQLSRSIAELREPVPPAAILALLSQLIPEDIVVNRLLFQAPPAHLNDTSGRSEHGVSHAGPRYVQIQIEGTTPIKLSITRLTSLLADQSVFSNVAIEDLRQADNDNGLSWRFRISMKIPLKPLTGARS